MSDLAAEICLEGGGVLIIIVIANYLSIRPRGSMWAIVYPDIPFPVFFLLLIIIPSSLELSLISLII